MLDIIKDYATGGLVDTKEFEAGEDDMAFVAGSNQSPFLKKQMSIDSGTSGSTFIANDVIHIPTETHCKHRLAISFALAQSTVLSILETRITNKVDDYKYIPETLAETGQVVLSARLIGTMVGEIFVIRHDLNLHTDILDTPDFFWF